jgi:hypothetical protein
MKRERLRQVFKERFEDFDADNNCVTTFVISKNIGGFWHVKLKCRIIGGSTIDLKHYLISKGNLISNPIYYDIIDRCEWVGDYFYCKLNVRASESCIYMSFHPLNEV